MVTASSGNNENDNEPSTSPIAFDSFGRALAFAFTVACPLGNKLSQVVVNGTGADFLRSASGTSVSKIPLTK